MEAKLGKNKILAFRKLSAANSKTGAKLAFQIEHTLSYERSNESTATKDGAVIIPGGLVTKMDIQALASNDPINTMLMESVINGEKLEIWEIDLTAPVGEVGNEFAALYMRGNLNSWSVPSPTEGPVQITTSASIDGTPQKDTLTFTQDELNEIQYAFRDLSPVV